jgi:hypothetical protein
MLRSTEEDIQDIFGAECGTSRRKNDWLRSESFSNVNAIDPQALANIDYIPAKRIRRPAIGAI